MVVANQKKKKFNGISLQTSDGVAKTFQPSIKRRVSPVSTKVYKSKTARVRGRGGRP